MRIKTILSIAISIWLAGCTTPPLPPELIYSPPTSGPVAFIKGSDRKSSVPIFDHETAYVFAVNGKRTALERKGWSSEIVIPTGPVAIAAAFEQGAYFGVAKFELTPAEGQKFEVRAQTDGKYERRYVEIWIVDAASEKPVTEAVRVSVRQGGGGTFVPIFIPR